jgi:hypothetical protein
MASRFGLLAVIGALIALALPTGVLGAAPPYLDGEALGANWSPSTDTRTSATCDVSASTIEYDISGLAAGPYAGTFTEHGVINIGPQTNSPLGFDFLPTFPYFIPGTRGALTGAVTSATIEFTIVSGEGTVTGTKTYAGSSDAFGTCLVLEDDPIPPDLGGGTGSGYYWSFRGTFDYDATIVSPSGTFNDSGTSLAGLEEGRVFRTDGSGAETGNFGELYFSNNAPQGATTVTVTPETATNPVGTSHSVLATATRSAGQPAAGTTLLLSVSGSTNQAQSCVADINGQCLFTYTGPAFPGADLILVCADNDGNGSADAGEPCAEATKAWLLPTSTAGQVTGGGQVLNPEDNEKVAFGFNAKSTANGLIGNCSVVDIAPTRNIKIKCLTVTTLVVSGNAATIYGTGTINGTNTNYRIEVTDNGEPGTGTDTFTILTGSGYSAGGVLDSGNIQVHR